jgi:uncharacterized protein (TIGR03067 family)
MNVHLCFALAAGLLATAPQAEGDAVKKDLKKLDGTWKFVSFESGGEKVKGKFFNKLTQSDKLTIKDGETKVTYNDQTFPARILIDPTKKLKTFELIITDGEFKGLNTLALYELEGDDLRICYDAQQEMVRPDQFNSQGTRVVVTYKREKSK